MSSSSTLVLITLLLSFQWMRSDDSIVSDSHTATVSELSGSASSHKTSGSDSVSETSEFCEAGSESCSVEEAESGHEKYQAPADQRGQGYVYRNTRPSETGNIPQFDLNGYVFFCPCMGRLGNQIEHFLGGLAFAKKLNRTFVVPPLRTYRNVRFTEWFQFEPLLDYHRAVLAEDFMEYIAPSHWPPGKRIGFCWLPDNTKNPECTMKKGNPFEAFWDGLKVDFDDYVIHHLNYHGTPDVWHDWYPASRYPVLAFRGAPARYPILAHHRDLQKLLVFSERIEQEADNFINRNFPAEKFVGIHLRNGGDWANACQRVEGLPYYMASPQCLDGTGKKVTKQLCWPSKEEVIRLTREAVISTGARVIFVATDKSPMIEELEQELQQYKVKVYNMNPHLPVIDLAILTKSNHFIGNCVSSFTAFVKRARDLENKPTTFWGLS